MAASTIERDRGVSDVLKMTENLKQQQQQFGHVGTVKSVSNDETVETNNHEPTDLFTLKVSSSETHGENGDVNKTDIEKVCEHSNADVDRSRTDSEKEYDRSCEPKGSSCDSGIEDVRNSKGSGSSNSVGGGSVPLNIDFGDPTQVINLLETVDLSEEDTEYLLQEAYSMNKKLKEMLRRQEGEASDQTPKQQKQKHNKLRKQDAASNSGSREGSSFGARQPLPPISCDKETTNLYTMKLRRARTNIPSQSFVHQHTETVPRSKSSKAAGRDSGNAVTQKPKSRTKDPKQEERPDWNSRWTYT